MEKKSDLLDGEIEEVAMSKKAIFEIITEHIDTLDIADGEIISLGNDFHLPQEEKDGMKFVDGAWDGISIYHMGTPEITDADYLYILTAVDRVCINFNKPGQAELKAMTCAEAEEYSAQGQFAPGSMLPKVKAGILFASSKKGRKAVICSLEKTELAMSGQSGTIIT